MTLLSLGPFLHRRLRLGWLGITGATEALLAQVTSAQRALAKELRRAIDGDELELHYQPIAAMKSGKVPAVEALVRWRHPKRGFLWPADFVAQAMQMDVGEELNLAVLERALDQHVAWHKQGIELNVTASPSSVGSRPPTKNRPS